MDPAWFMLFLTVWLVVIFAAAFALVRRIRRNVKAMREEHGRPEYEFGNSVADWEAACEKSQAWSLSRRNGNGIEKEVKS
jgi:hypothetical protein